MKLPTSVIVGYRTYAIEELSVERSDADDIVGLHHNHPPKIEVRTEGIAPEDAANTLLHEILHACWEVGNLPKRASEEKAVHMLSNQLAQVWRDNPQVVAWVTATVARDGPGRPPARSGVRRGR
jgi:hypothetical protein